VNKPFFYGDRFNWTAETHFSWPQEDEWTPGMACTLAKTGYPDRTDGTENHQIFDEIMNKWRPITIADRLCWNGKDGTPLEGAETTKAPPGTMTTIDPTTLQPITVDEDFNLGCKVIFYFLKKLFFLNFSLNFFFRKMHHYFFSSNFLIMSIIYGSFKIFHFFKCFFSKCYILLSSRFHFFSIKINHNYIFFLFSKYPFFAKLSLFLDYLFLLSQKTIYDVFRLIKFNISENFESSYSNF